ncbi:MAG: 1-acyl-sn-glycerol-3-phosphate acyltransferase [Alphaproteobacteria bacterium]
MPRKIMMGATYIFLHTTQFLEKYILGLTYEIRGAEYLPKEGPYIVAAKHQSAYETFKLHFLFPDPATILKKELLKIPLWGKYLEKSDVIAIDRSSPKTAIKSMKEGALRVATQKRPIVVFPQGTRVAPGIGTDQVPYKMGVTRIQKATGLPIIPMATNTGVFYPKGGWCKSPGRAVFEFLPPIAPSSDRSPAETIKLIETAIENKSNALIKEGYAALQKQQNRFGLSKKLAVILMATLGIYSIYWFYSMNTLKTAYNQWLKDIKSSPYIQTLETAPLRIYGYPLQLKATLPHMTVTTPDGSNDIKNIRVKGWLLPDTPITLETGSIDTKINADTISLAFDSFEAQFNLFQNGINIKTAQLLRADSKLTASGTIITQEPPNAPDIKLDIILQNHAPFLAEMVQNNVIEKDIATTATIFLQLLQKPDGVHTSLITHNNALYLGPLRIYDFNLHNMIYSE